MTGCLLPRSPRQQKTDPFPNPPVRRGRSFVHSAEDGARCPGGSRDLNAFRRGATCFFLSSSQQCAPKGMPLCKARRRIIQKEAAVARKEPCLCLHTKGDSVKSIRVSKGCEIFFKRPLRDGQSVRTEGRSPEPCRTEVPLPEDGTRLSRPAARAFAPAPGTEPREPRLPPRRFARRKFFLPGARGEGAFPVAAPGRVDYSFSVPRGAL